MMRLTTFELLFSNYYCSFVVVRAVIVHIIVFDVVL